jgi:hypothetical protein
LKRVIFFIIAILILLINLSGCGTNKEVEKTKTFSKTSTLYVSSSVVNSSNVFSNQSSLSSIVSSSALSGVSKNTKKYDYIGEYSEGLAVVGIGESAADGDIPLSEGAKFGAIDANGKEVIPLKYDYIVPFSEGLSGILNRTTNKWGFIDKTGKIIIEQKFDIPWTTYEGYKPRFSEGLQNVQISIDKNDINPKYGFIDITGKVVIQPKWSYASNFIKSISIIAIGGRWEANGEGYFLVNAGWGLIDKNGKETLPATNYSITYSNGNFMVKKTVNDNETVVK